MIHAGSICMKWSKWKHEHQPTPHSMAVDICCHWTLVLKSGKSTSRFGIWRSSSNFCYSLPCAICSRWSGFSGGLVEMILRSPCQPQTFCDPVIKSSLILTLQDHKCYLPFPRAATGLMFWPQNQPRKKNKAAELVTNPTHQWEQ